MRLGQTAWNLGLRIAISHTPVISRIAKPKTFPLASSNTGTWHFVLNHFTKTHGVLIPMNSQQPSETPQWEAQNPSKSSGWLSRKYWRTTVQSKQDKPCNDLIIPGREPRPLGFLQTQFSTSFSSLLTSWCYLHKTGSLLGNCKLAPLLASRSQFIQTTHAQWLVHLSSSLSCSWMLSLDN